MVNILFNIKGKNDGNNRQNYNRNQGQKQYPDNNQNFYQNQHDYPNQNNNYQNKPQQKTNFVDKKVENSEDNLYKHKQASIYNSIPDDKKPKSNVKIDEPKKEEKIIKIDDLFGDSQVLSDKNITVKCGDYKIEMYDNDKPEASSKK